MSNDWIEEEEEDDDGTSRSALADVLLSQLNGRGIAVDPLYVSTHEPMAISDEIRVALKEKAGGSVRNGTTGGLVWNAAKCLSRMIACGRPSDSSWTWTKSGRPDRTFWGSAIVYDLGAGTGLCGLTAALVGADVVLTDLPALMGLLRVNIEENRAAVRTSGGSVVARVLDWTKPGRKRWWYEADAMTTTKKKHIVVLCSDVVFGNTKGWSALLENMLNPLLNDETATTASSVTVLLAFEDRADRFPSPGFFSRLHELFRVEKIDVEERIGDQSALHGTFASQRTKEDEETDDDENGGESTDGRRISIFRLHRAGSA